MVQFSKAIHWGNFGLGVSYKRRKNFYVYVASFTICEDYPPYPACARGYEFVFGPVCLSLDLPCKKAKPVQSWQFYP